jgi:hypothetical protein
LVDPQADPRCAQVVRQLQNELCICASVAEKHSWRISCHSRFQFGIQRPFVRGTGERSIDSFPMPWDITAEASQYKNGDCRSSEQSVGGQGYG